MEHRHTAQQKILEQQQKQIKEQQKLIEELTYLQKQQLNQQQIMAEALLKQNSGQDASDGNSNLLVVGNNNNHGGKTVTIDNNAVAKDNKTKVVPKLSTHLDSLQKDLVQEAENSTARYCLIISKELFYMGFLMTFTKNNAYTT